MSNHYKRCLMVYDLFENMIEPKLFTNYVRKVDVLFVKFKDISIRKVAILF